MFWRFLSAHAQKQRQFCFRSKNCPHHRVQRPRFPIRQMHFNYRVSFTGYIRCFCATTSHDLVTLTFWPWECFVYSASHVRPIYQLLSYDYRLLSYEYWISDHISVIWKSLRMRRVTWPLNGGKNSPHFWNSWPKFAYSLCHFQGTTTKIKPCYRQKIAFSHYEGYKVHCVCAVSRDLCIGGPPKPHVTIFDPELPIHYTTFMRLPWRLRVVYIGASPC